MVLMESNDDIEKALAKLAEQQNLGELEIIFLQWYCDLSKEERQKLLPKIEAAALSAIRDMLKE